MRRPTSRQLTPEQVTEVRERARAEALRLRADGKTQAEIAEAVGVPRETVRD